MIKELIIGKEGFGRKSSINKKEIQLCKEWIKKWILPRKTINTDQGSYGLKHIVEKSSKIYISNGAFIKAAIELGYNYKKNNLNAFFSISFVKAKKNNESGYNII